MGEERFKEVFEALIRECLKIEAIVDGNPDGRSDSDPIRELTDTLVSACRGRRRLANRHGFDDLEDLVYAVMAALVEEIKVPSNRTLRAKYVRNAIKRVAIRVSGGKE